MDIHPPSRLPYMEITEDLLGCGTLDGFWERVQYWAGTVTKAKSLEVAFLQRLPGSTPGRILYYTGKPQELTPIRLSLICLAAEAEGRTQTQVDSWVPRKSGAAETVLSRSFEILPEVVCVVLAEWLSAKEPGEVPLDAAGRDFQRLLKFSFTILRHSPLMECLRHVCQRMCQEQLDPCAGGLGPEIFNLTRRECEVLHWIDAGKQDSEIAMILGMNVRTVQTHVRALLRKLDCENRLQLMTLHLGPVLGAPVSQTA